MDEQGQEQYGETVAWAVWEMGDTELGDLRRSKRLVQLTSALVANPACSLPEACKDWKDTKAAYRFLGNEDMEPSDILGGHRRSTAQRIGQYPWILAVQDTTVLSFTGHPATKGLGPVGGKRSGQKQAPQGVFVHSCLAVTPEGLPLGLLGQKRWVRPGAEGESEDKGGSGDSAKVGKESVRWIEMLRSASDVPAGTRVLTVADREADIYDFFAEAIHLGQDVLVRASHNRWLAGDTERLWDVLEQANVTGQMVIEVPRADDRRPRTATLELHTAWVRLRTPKEVSTLTLSAVLAREVEPPSGEEPIEWYLLTTLTVGSAEDAQKCVEWYTKRWLIERFHYTLKSGCKIEELQLETINRLERAVTVYSVVAWRLLYLTYRARLEPESPCTAVLSDEEWKALYCHVHKSKHVPANPPNLQTAVLWIAKLGGFLGRKRDGHPGVKVLWRGYRRLQDAVVMWKVFQSDN